MIDLLSIYICPIHGEMCEDVVMHSEMIDTERDEAYHIAWCVCGREVRPKVEDGVQCFEKVDHERWLWATGFYDEPDDLD